MLDQLTQLVQQQAPQALANVPGVPAGQQEAISREASQSLMASMQQLLQQGGPGALKGLFQGAGAGDAQNLQMQQVTDSVATNLAQKTGLSSNVARSIGVALIPIVLGQLFKRAKDPNDSSFSITDILGSLLGGRATTGQPAGAGGGVLGSVLGGVLGGGASGKKPGGLLDRDGDGDTDLADLMAMFK